MKPFKGHHLARPTCFTRVREGVKLGSCWQNTNGSGKGTSVLWFHMFEVLAFMGILIGMVYWCMATPLEWPAVSARNASTHLKRFENKPKNTRTKVVKSNQQLKRQNPSTWFPWLGVRRLQATRRRARLLRRARLAALNWKVWCQHAWMKLNASMHTCLEWTWDRKFQSVILFHCVKFIKAANMDESWKGAETNWVGTSKIGSNPIRLIRLNHLISLD